MKFQEALNKAIKQWELMRDANISKDEAYKQLGGLNMERCCFLCDACMPVNSTISDCSKCLTWDEPMPGIGGMLCTRPYSVYRDYVDFVCRLEDLDKPKEYYINRVLQYLKQFQN